MEDCQIYVMEIFCIKFYYEMEGTTKGQDIYKQNLRDDHIDIAEIQEMINSSDKQMTNRK